MKSNTVRFWSIEESFENLEIPEGDRVFFSKITALNTHQKRQISGLKKIVLKFSNSLPSVEIFDLKYMAQNEILV